MSLDTVRGDAASAFEKTGFPSPRDEAWKYTPTRGWARRTPRATPGEADLSDRWYIQQDVARLVFIDGRLDLRWSRPPAGVDAIAACPTLGDILPASGGFPALSLADFTGGAWVRGAGELLVVHHTTGAGVVPVRHRIEVAPGATLEICTWFEGAPGESLAVCGTEIDVGDGGCLRWVDHQHAPTDGHVVHVVGAVLGAESVLEGGFVGMGGQVARLELHATLGRAARIALTGLTLARGSRHQDFHTHVVHAGARSVSQQRFKAILDDTARGVYSGRVVVGREVAGCDVAQRSASLLLSDRAISNARPQLEIHNDDVAATHGATVGQLDAEALFFLAARGLDPSEAATLLTTAFANDAIDGLPLASVRDPIRAQVSAWLTEAR